MASGSAGPMVFPINSATGGRWINQQTHPVYSLQSDLYATSRIQDVVPEEYERQAAPTYNNSRRASPSVREWYEKYYQGEKDDVAWTLAVNIDLEIESHYRAGGYPGVEQALATSDVLETSLNVLGTRHAVGLTRDTRLGDHLTLTRPPGESQVLPSSVIEEGRTESQALYKQEQRTGGAATTRQRRAGWFSNNQQPTQTPKGKPKAKAKGQR